MKRFLFAKFRKDEDGAVTVDWVVLTAAVVGMGIAVLSQVSGAVATLTSSISTELNGTTITTTF